MNWPAIIITGLVSLFIIVALFIRNLKDEKKVEQQLKDDYPKPPDDEADIETDEIMK